MMERIWKGLIYRLTQSPWRKLAIHHAFSGYSWNKVYLKEIGLTLFEDQCIQLLEAYENAKKLASHSGQFRVSGDKLILEVDNISIELQTAEELFIAKEIFVDRCYDFYLPNKCVVIDIGMNVGMASLFFANKPSVKKVYGFEPFKPTFDQAEKNFSRNSKLNNKIARMNVGWGLVEDFMEVEYSRKNRGRVGIYGRKLVKGEVDDLLFEKMEVNSAYKLMSDVLTGEPDEHIVVKMDCEGAEFGIIENLKQHTLLESIHMVMMEWHQQEPTSIIDSLTGAGFRLFKMNYTPDVGMIYGVR